MRLSAHTHYWYEVGMLIEGKAWDREYVKVNQRLTSCKIAELASR